MDLSSPDKVIDFTKAIEQAAEPMRTQLAERLGIDGCYYEAVQWISRGFRPGIDRSGSITRLTVDWNPDSRKLRAIANQTTMLTQKSWASTYPGEIYMKVEPPERDTGADAAYRTRVHENTVNCAIDDSHYLNNARYGNRRRAIFGVALMGLSLESSPEGRYVCAFDGEPTGLILDPNCQHLQLHRHPFVCYHDVWTLDRIESVFGVVIKPENAKTFAQLDPQKIEMNALSNNRLFSRYVRYSDSKGARVYQLHVREGRRFPKWYVLIETAANERQLINGDDLDTPFGGCGMPFALLHGYQRADTMWSWGEPAQVKDDQDKRNLRETMRERLYQQYVHARPVVDRRWFGTQAANDDSIINTYFTNQIGMPIIGSGSDRARNAQPPQYMMQPAPPPGLDEAIERLGETMRDKTHKAPGNFGIAKTHIPDATNQRVLDDADQVATERIGGDVEAHNYLTGVLLGTTIKLAQERNTPTLAMLRADGFDKQDFAVLLESDYRDPPVSMHVMEGSFRNVSTAAKKQNLDTAAQLQMIEPADYQDALTELGMPLTEKDRHMMAEIGKGIVRVLNGEPWIPRPLGRWSKHFEESATMAQFDRKALADPRVAQMLVRAIQSQQALSYQQQLLADPELAIKMQQAQQPEPEGDEAQEPQPGESASVADILSSLSQGGGAGVSAQPAAAA